MSEGQAELLARAAAYKKEALQTTKDAENATSEQRRVDLLRLAEEMLRLSGEMELVAASMAGM